MAQPIEPSPNARRRRHRADRTARETVLVARALWTEPECALVREALRRALDRRGGGGWTAGRHADFPTTDLPAFELSPRAFSWVRRAVRERVIAPFANRHGLDPADLYFKDLFFVLYDADNEGGQRHLDLHHDGSLFSFNILLNSEKDFHGGGTLFPALGPVCINQGDCCMHDGRVLHGGNPVTKGHRIILVGFVESIVSEEHSLGDSSAATARRDEAELRALRERMAVKAGGRQGYDALALEGFAATLGNLQLSDDEDEDEELDAAGATAMDTESDRGHTTQLSEDELVASRVIDLGIQQQH